MENTAFGDYGDLGEVDDVVYNSFDNASNGGNESDYYYYNEPFETPFDTLHIRLLFIIAYVFVFILCFFGNLMVIIVILVHRKMRTITNFFLANLALADFCVGVFCVLPNLSMNLEAEWKLGKVMCKLYYFVQNMSYTASITILTVISVERYVAIIYPLRSKRLTTLNRLRGVVIGVWLLAAISGAPFLVIYEHVPIGTVAFCLPNSNVNIGAYVTANFVLWYAMPLLLMTVLYTRISVVLWKSSVPNNLDARNEGRVKQKRGQRSIVFQAHWLTCCRKSNEQAPNQARSVRLVSFNETVVEMDGQNSTVVSTIKHPQTLVKGHVDNQQHGSPVHYSSIVSEHSVVNPTPVLTSSETEDSDESSNHPDDYENDWPEATPSNAKQTWHVPMRQIRDQSNGTTQPRSKAENAANGPTRGAVARRKNDNRANSTLMARRKIIRLLLAVVISFALCVLPYHARVLWQYWSDGLSLSPYQVLYTPISFLILYFNNGLNPLLYAFLSDNFRRSLKQVLTCTHNRPVLARTSVLSTRTNTATVRSCV